MRRYPQAGCAVDSILLPRPDLDWTRWAVVACDQFTSQPEYWEAAGALVGDAPSTLRLIYPEVWLNEADPDTRIQDIRAHMRRYLEEGVFQAVDGIVYTERQVGTKTRKGILLCLDLEQYDYRKGSGTLIRATEGTIVERLPPRMRIRAGAPIELPHIMVLLDDPDDTVIGPITAARDANRKVYDFDLMQGSGHIAGWVVEDRGLEQRTIDALAALGDRATFEAKYHLEGRGLPVLLYAMGDGNHSLATAKAIWEKTKADSPDPASVMDDPTRYALVELVNIYDASLEFEPIHRVLFHVRSDLLQGLTTRFGADLTSFPVADVARLEAEVKAAPAGTQRFGLLRAEGLLVVQIANPPTALAVGTLQAFLDPWVKAGNAREIDYVHGTDVVHDLGVKPGNVGLYLSGMEKSDLFKSVILDGALPRKTFSMGEARDKRFYLECRRLG